MFRKRAEKEDRVKVASKKRKLNFSDDDDGEDFPSSLPVTPTSDCEVVAAPSDATAATAAAAPAAVAATAAAAAAATAAAAAATETVAARRR